MNVICVPKIGTPSSRIRTPSLQTPWPLDRDMPRPYRARMTQSNKPVLLTAACLLLLGCAIAEAGSPEDEVYDSIYKILPKGWSLVKYERRIVIWRNEDVTFYNTIAMPTTADEKEAKKNLEDRIKAGRKDRYKIQLVLGPRLEQREYDAIKKTLPGYIGRVKDSGGVREFAALHDTGLPDSYGEGFSVYLSVSSRMPIWPNYLDEECHKALESIRGLFKKYQNSGLPASGQ